MLNKCRVTLFLVAISCALASCGVRRFASLPHVTSNNFYCEHPRLDENQIDSLRAIYGNNKEFCESFIEPILIALSYYPELKNTNINFKYSKEATTMAARPRPMSMFSKREYLVLINNEDDFEGILLRDVPFNAQIGVVGHELAHIADYQNRNFWGVVGVLFRYSDNKRKPLFEKEIDYATIKRGLGWQLYDWALYSMVTNTEASEEYKEFKKEVYMEPCEIKEMIYFLSKYGHIAGK